MNAQRCHRSTRWFPLDRIPLRRTLAGLPSDPRSAAGRRTFALLQSDTGGSTRVHSADIHDATQKRGRLHRLIETVTGHLVDDHVGTFPPVAATTRSTQPDSAELTARSVPNSASLGWRDALVEVPITNPAPNAFAIRLMCFPPAPLHAAVQDLARHDAASLCTAASCGGGTPNAAYQHSHRGHRVCARVFQPNVLHPGISTAHWNHAGATAFEVNPSREYVGQVWSFRTDGRTFFDIQRSIGGLLCNAISRTAKSQPWQSQRCSDGQHRRSTDP
jgi:hypothetical protein